MRWCAGFFEGCVRYGVRVDGVERGEVDPKTGKLRGFEVRWRGRDGDGRIEGRAMARHVVIAVGGEPNVPEPFRNASGEFCFLEAPRSFPKHTHASYEKAKRIKVRQRRHIPTLYCFSQSSFSIPLLQKWNLG